jgi:hypothetical protein
VRVVFNVGDENSILESMLNYNDATASDANVGLRSALVYLLLAYTVLQTRKDFLNRKFGHCRVCTGQRRNTQDAGCSR